MTIRFGWSTDIENANLLASLGYDYIECSVGALSLEDSAEFAKVLPAYKESPLRAAAWNCLLPGDLKVVGPNVDRERVHRYIWRAVEVLSSLGAERVVFGSGGSRRVPDGWDRSRAEEQILDLLRVMSDAARGTDIVFVIEPLNSRESNIINNISEAVHLATQIAEPSVRVLADLYHMDEEKEPLSVLELHVDWLSHIHVADTGRRAPGTGSYPYEEFAGLLTTAGYSGMVSVECRTENLAIDAARSLEFMRNKWGLTDAT